MICLTSLLDFPYGCSRRPKGHDKLMLSSPLPQELFVNPRCPPFPTAIKAIVVGCIIVRVCTWASKEGTILDLCSSP